MFGGKRLLRAPEGDSLNPIKGCFAVEAGGVSVVAGCTLRRVSALGRLDTPAVTIGGDSSCYENVMDWTSTDGSARSKPRTVVPRRSISDRVNKGR